MRRRAHLGSEKGAGLGGAAEYKLPRPLSQFSRSSRSEVQLKHRVGQTGCRSAAPEGLSFSSAETALLYREKPQQPTEPSHAGARHAGAPNPPGGSLLLPTRPIPPPSSLLPTGPQGRGQALRGIGAPGASASAAMTQHVDVSDAQARAAPPSLSECRPARGRGPHCIRVKEQRDARCCLSSLSPFNQSRNPFPHGIALPS